MQRRPAASASSLGCGGLRPAQAAGRHARGVLSLRDTAFAPLLVGTDRNAGRCQDFSKQATQRDALGCLL